MDQGADCNRGNDIPRNLRGDESANTALSAVAQAIEGAEIVALPDDLPPTQPPDDFSPDTSATQCNAKMAL